jgi:hypothetical protein
MSGKRRVAIIAAAGALTITTAVSAAAASLPNASATGSSTVSRTSGTTTGTTTDAITATMAQADLALANARAASLTKAHQAKVASAAAKAAAAAAQVAAERRAHTIYTNRLAQEKAAAEASSSRSSSSSSSSSTSTSTSSSSSTSTSSGSDSSTSYSGSPEEIAQEMLASYGWSGQYSCLYNLWEKESDWSVSAYNASSGAYGIPQALPGSKMASAGSDWQTDAATQITWGLEYIESTYGSPCAAWDHEESDGWY